VEALEPFSHHMPLVEISNSNCLHTHTLAAWTDDLSAVMPGIIYA
jgi:hypothetical protein